MVGDTEIDGADEDLFKQLSPDDAYLSCKYWYFVPDTLTDKANVDHDVRCQSIRAPRVLLPAKYPPVTKEDMKTLKDDWLTDNVGWLNDPFMLPGLTAIVKVIAFWEEYVEIH